MMCVCVCMCVGVCVCVCVCVPPVYLGGLRSPDGRGLRKKRLLVVVVVVEIESRQLEREREGKREPPRESFARRCGLDVFFWVAPDVSARSCCPSWRRGPFDFGWGPDPGTYMSPLEAIRGLVPFPSPFLQPARTRALASESLRLSVWGARVMVKVTVMMVKPRCDTGDTSDRKRRDQGEPADPMIDDR